MTSTFKGGIGGYACWSASPEFPGSCSLPCVFPTIFVLQSNDLPSETLPLTLCEMRLGRKHPLPPPVLTLLPHWGKILILYLMPVPNY